VHARGGGVTFSSAGVVRVHGARSARTPALKRTLNPEWNRTLTFGGRLDDLVAREMEVEVFSSSLMRKPALLGKVRVDLKPLLESAEVDLGELPIEPPHRGVLALTVGFSAQHGRDPNAAAAAAAASARSSRAAPSTIAMM
jgi:hypothetical protein